MCRVVFCHVTAEKGQFVLSYKEVFHVWLFQSVLVPQAFNGQRCFHKTGKPEQCERRVGGVIQRSCASAARTSDSAGLAPETCDAALDAVCLGCDCGEQRDKGKVR